MDEDEGEPEADEEGDAEAGEEGDDGNIDESDVNYAERRANKANIGFWESLFVCGPSPGFECAPATGFDQDGGRKTSSLS